MNRAIRSVHAPTRAQFAEIIARKEPVVLTGLVDAWPAVTRWPALDYLRARVGDDVVPVEFYPGGDTGRHSSYVCRRMRVSEFLDGIHPRPGGPAMYLIVPLPPALANDAPPPPILTGISQTIWLLGDRTYSNLHFHPFQDSLACQVVGRKTFGIYPPEETRNLYPQPLFSKWFEFTRIERFDAADPGRYPRLARARGVEVTLEPGMALFIPRHFWHWASTNEIASHVLYYFGPKEPAGWVRTAPGRRSLFWLGRMTVQGAARRLRRRIEARLGIAPPPEPVGDRPSRE